MGNSPNPACCLFLYMKSIRVTLDHHKDEQEGLRANQAWNTDGGKNDKTEAVLLHAHHEKAGSLEKTIMLGKIIGSRKRARPNMRWTDCKISHRSESTGTEQGCVPPGIVDITHSEGHQGLEPFKGTQHTENALCPFVYIVSKAAFAPW